MMFPGKILARSGNRHATGAAFVALPGFARDDGPMARPADDDDDVDLGISLETVATVVDHVRAIQATEETDPAQLSEDENSEAALLQENPDDMTEDSLREFIDGLN